MPLGEFIAEVMELLKTAATEICVKRVYPLRFAAEKGQAAYEQVFQGLNREVAAGQ